MLVAKAEDVLRQMFSFNIIVPMFILFNSIIVVLSSHHLALTQKFRTSTAWRHDTLTYIDKVQGCHVWQPLGLDLSGRSAFLLASLQEDLGRIVQCGVTLFKHLGPDICSLVV